MLQTETKTWYTGVPQNLQEMTPIDLWKLFLYKRKNMLLSQQKSFARCFDSYCESLSKGKYIIWNTELFSESL